ncbi:T1SS-143 repeat domain-containing protein [Poseidonibacter antarcticus]|uniref:T1SS-143 repeat domain-containing protein n=1 Tax=Poseidonibacter antarcticus TaxID=2478538 RepID=UPI000EF48DA3|nr:VCBS domain-containing protein [Poseidonibacter antarcticus]
MATIAGSIISLSNGTFNVKDENGNIRVLKVGDEIYENDTIYGNSDNSSSSRIEIQLSGNDVIVLSQGQEQLIDSSLIETAFGTEELFFTRESLNLNGEDQSSNVDIISDLRDAEFVDEKLELEEDGSISDNDDNITEEETAEGEEEAEDEALESGEFEARDGTATDINTDLRNTQFVARTQTFEDLTQFESESEGRLTPNNATERPDYTDSIVNTPSVPTVNPTPPSVIPVDNTEEEVVETPVSTPIIGNLSINNATNYENDGFLIFTVTLDRSLSSSVTFDYDTTAITASANGEDYSDISGSITIPAGSISTTIQVPIINDYISDNGETVRINISNVEGNANISNSEAIGTILDNVDTAIVSISGDELVEEGSAATYKIEVDQVIASGETITVPLTYSYISASSEDIITNTVQIILDENNQSVNFNIETIEDTLAEGSEVFNVIIGTPIDTGSFENIDLGNDTVSTVIEDNLEDTAIVSLVGPANVVEGETTASYTVSVDQLATDVKTDITVTFTYTGVAVDGTDFTGVSSVIIPAGSNSTTFDITTLDDALAEGTESFNIAINAITDTNFEAITEHATDNNVTTTITEDLGTNPVDSDITATVVVGDAATVTEANNTYLTYDVKLSNAVGENVEVTLATSGTATAGTDYESNLEFFDGTSWVAVPADGKITLPADASTVQVRAEVKDDAITEPNETVVLAATTTDSQITDSSDTGSGTITDDRGTDNPNVDSDITATVVVGDAATVTEANNTYLTYDVKLSNAVGENVEVTLATSGTATAGTDYESNLEFFDGTSWVAVPADGKITLPADASTVQVRAEVKDDAITEPNETVVLAATTTDSQITDSSDTGSGTITDEINLTNKTETVVEGTHTITSTTESLNLLDNDEIGANGKIVSFEYKDEAGNTQTATLSNVGGVITATANTQYGSVTVNEDGTWSFTSDATENNPTGVDDVITYKVQDSTGATATAKFTVTVTDTAPTAVADTNTVIEDTTLTANGNVINNTTDDTQDDISGADTPIVVLGVAAGSDTSSDVTEHVGDGINGTYGSVKIESDGSYIYTLTNDDVRVQHLIPDETLTDIFTYTIKDADGDTSTTTLTITIKGTNDVPTITAVDGNSSDAHPNGDATVYESGLAAGSDASATTETTSGTITISAKDGLVSVNIGGTDITQAQLLDSGTTAINIDTGEGTLVINGFTPSDGTHQDGSGTINYTYTLKTEQTHADADGNNEVTDVISLTVTDRNETSAPATNLTITIVDDVPTAVNDTRDINEGATNSITGNVVTGTTNGDNADHGNADGFIGSPVIKLMYGATEITLGTRTETDDGYITFNSDGSYTFEAKSDLDNPLGADLVETFTYTIEDKDGDETSATLTINVKDLDATISGSTVSMYENTLPDGSDTDALATSVTGELSVTPATDTFDVQFDVSTLPSELSSGGVDLVYKISVDGHTLTATAGNSGPTVFTTVLSDTATTTPDYTFTLSAPLDHADAAGANELAVTSGVKVIEFDGDVATTTFTVNIVDDVPAANVDTNTVIEDTTLTVNGNVIVNTTDDTQNDISGADTPIVVLGVAAGSDTSSDVTEHVGDGINGTYGSVKIESDGRYIYTLTNNDVRVQHLIPDETLTDIFTYTIKDADGDTSTTTLTITIKGTNDVPTITAVDGNSSDAHPNGDATVYESGLATGSDASATTETTSGTITISAKDGLVSVNIGGTDITQAQLLDSGTTAINIDTGEGTLVINGFTPSDGTHQDGSGTINYTYTLKTEQTHADADGNNEVTDVISLTVTDRNETSAPATNLTITIVDDVPTAKNNSATVVEGTTAAITGNVITDDDTSGVDIVGADEAILNNFTYTKADGTADETLTFSDSNTTYTVITPTGELTVNQNGSWKFTPIASVDHDDNSTAVGTENNSNTSGSFTYTLIDGDGDVSSEATNTITVTDTIATVAPIDTVIIDEDDLTSGSESIKESLTSENNSLGITTGKDDITDVVFDISKINADTNMTSLKSGGQALTFSLSDSNHVLTAKDSIGNDVFVVTINNNGTANDYDENSTYTFELKGVLDHTTADGENNLDIDIPFSVVEIDDTVESQIKVNITDDIPTAVEDTSVVTVNEGNVPLTGVNLLDNDVTGADGLSTVTGFKYTDEEGNEQTGTLGTQVDTQYGLLTVNSDGSWSYISDGSEINNTAAVTDNFTYTITDFDGDISSAIQEIKVTDGANPTNDGATSASLDEDDLSSGSDTVKETLVATGDLNIGSGTDALDTVFDTTGTETLTSNGKAIVYTLSDDGHTITGKVGSKEIFVATITDPDNETASTGYTFELKGTIDHDAASGENSKDVVLHYIATDADGDTAANDLTVAIIDDIPTIGTADTATVNEANLASGSNPDNAALTQTGSLAVNKDADSFDTTFSTSQTTLDALNLTSQGTPLSYTISADGHKLTATAGGDTIFTVKINKFSTSSAKYKFTLSGVIDNSEETTALPFSYQVVDYDGDSVTKTFTINVVDDNLSIQDYTIDEDSGEATYATQAGATSSNTSIHTSPVHGIATIDTDGKLHYTPNDEYSGVDTLTYTVEEIDENGVLQTTTTTVTFTVNPISDAPGVTVDADTVYTLEDTPVALGLNAPTITDTTDNNGAALGDNPELLGLVTLSGIPSGVELSYGGNTFTSTGGDITIKFTDNDTHLNGLSGETLSMSKDDFNLMEVRPSSQDAKDFKVTMKVTEYEVDESGNIFEISGNPVAGAESTITVDVDVLAVTDPVDIKINNSDTSYETTIDEDRPLDLQSLLTVTFADMDGSENRSIVLSDLPSGTIINGNTITTGTYTIDLNSDGTIPALSLTPPKNFSGDMSDITITLVAHDTDTDSTHNDESSVDTTTLANKTIYDSKDSVTLSLHVNPIADDIADMVAKTTDEDTAVAFLSDFDLTDKDIAGTESVMKVVITGLDEGSVVVYGGVTTTIDSSGTFTIGDGSSILDIATIQAATITPPAHSSLDMSITVTATVQDVNVIDGIPITNTATDLVKTFDLVVSPIAESTETNTAGTISGTDGNDIITQGTHNYATKANEDEFFNLNITEGTFTGLTLINEDSASETTTVLFTAKDENGADLIGTIFTYGGETTEFIYAGTAVEIPSTALDTLQVKAPAEYSGTMILTTQIKSIDYDDDASNKESPSTAISQGDTLTITVNPIADDVTVAIKQSFGNEDAGIDLNVGVSSSDKDGSESYTLKLSDIPDGAQIYYNGQLVTLSSGTITVGTSDSTTGQFSDENFEIVATDSNSSDGKWELEIKNFDKSKLFTYVPEEDSNENITLKVQAQAVDGSDVNPADLSTAPKLDILVKVTGVADTPTYDNPVDSVTDDTYNAVVTEDTSSISLYTLFPSDTPNFSSVDISTVGDDSETLFVTISDLPAGFGITGTDVVKIGDNWVVEASNFNSIKLTIPSDYSGEVELNLKLQTIEDDGDKSLIEIIPLKILVTPEAESTVNIHDSQEEDSGDNVLDFSFTRADSGEKLESIWINTESIDAGVSLITNNATLTQTSVGSAQWVELTVTNDIVETVTAQLDSSWADKSGAYNFDIRYSVSDTVADGGVTYTDYSTTTSGSDIYNETFSDPSDYITKTYTVGVTPITDAAISSISNINSADTSKALVSGDDTVGYAVTAAKTNVIINVPFELDSVSDKDGSEQITTITVSGVPEGVSVVGGTYLGDILSDTGTIINSGKWSLPITDNTLDSDGTSNTIEFNINGEAVNFNGETTTETISIGVSHQDSQDEELTNVKSFTLVIDDNFDGTDGTNDNVTDVQMDMVLTPIADVQLTEDVDFNLAQLVTATDGTTTADSSNYAILVSNLPSGYSVSGTTETKNVDGTTYYVLYGEGNVSNINTSLGNIIVSPNENENTLEIDKVDLDIKVITYTSETNQNSYLVDGTTLDAELAPVSDETTIAISGSDVAESSSPTSQTITLDLSNDADGNSRTIIKGGTVYVKFAEDYTDDSTDTVIGTITYNGTNINTLTPDGDGYYAITGITDLDTNISFVYTPPENHYGTLVIDSKVTTQEDVNGATDQNGDIYETSEVESPIASKTITITPVNDGITPFTPIMSGNEDEIVLLDFGEGHLIDITEDIISAKLTGIPFGYEVTNNGIAVTGTIIGQENGEYIYEYNFNVSSVAELEKIGVKKIGVEDFSGEITGVTLSVTSGEPGNETAQTSDSFNITFNAVADDLISFSPTDAIGDEYVNSESAWTQINLNINVQDTDGSETISVTFDGLPEDSSFSLDGGTTPIASSYDDTTGIYTISGIDYEKVNDLSVLTPTGYKGGTITTTAWTVDGSSTSAVQTTNTFDIILESKASGVTSFTSSIDNQIDTSKNNIISSSYTIALYVTSLDLLDKDGSESLYLKVSGLGDSFDLDVSSIAGVSATQNTDGDWIINIGNASDSTYEDALTALANGDIKLISTTTDGSVENIDISAYSQLEKNSDEKSDEVTVNDVALNVTVDTGTIDGTTGDDNIIGSDNADTINAGAGNDTINAGEGDDTIYGESGDDIINGEAGNDTIDGGIGTDTISGGEGDDIIDGGSENDIINADAGNDTIITDGLDTINGGTGYDIIQLEASASFDFSKLDNIEELDLTNGTHNISLSLQDVINMTDENNDLKITGNSTDSVLFEDGADNNKWSTTSTVTEDETTFDVYTNTDNASVQVKVEQIITDGITN